MTYPLPLHKLSTDERLALVEDQICRGCEHRSELRVTQDTQHWSPIGGYKTKAQVRCPKTCLRIAAVGLHIQEGR